MKKMLFLTARLPYPANSGRKNSLYNYCKYLNKMYGYEIINVSFLEKDDDINLKPDFISKTYVLEKPNNLNKIKNILNKTFIKNEMPLQVSMYYSDSIKDKISEIIDIERPNIVMCDMIRTAEYLKNVEIPKILDMDDMLSIRYRRQLALSLKDINPYGAFLYELPTLVQKILNIHTLKKFILKKETKLLQSYEVNISKYYDSVVFVSDKEAEVLNSIINEKKSYAVPIGVDIDYFMQTTKEEKENNSISFLGALNVTHNENAVIYLCEEILPIIKRRIADVKLYIVGGGATDRIKEIANANENIILTGRVDDVRTYIRRTKVFVAPLLFGSGIKTKNLEAMAMGVPVVTTSIGAESINAVKDKDWIIEDDTNEIANKIIKLLQDDELNNLISNNGVKYIANNFSWDSCMKSWKDVFDATVRK